MSIMVRITFAQSTAKIVGTVSDSRTGKPLSRANIQVDGTGYGTSTTEWGEFCIENLLEGTYSVTASHIGYAGRKISHIRISKDQPVHLHVKLTPAVIQMPQIMVSGDVYEDRLEMAVTVIDRKTIENSNSLSAGELLEHVPGIEIQNTGGIGGSKKISIRGSQTNQVLVLLDGMPLNDELGGDADLTDIPVNIIEKVEVYKGGSSDRFGSGALGGVVNIITRKSFQNQIQIRGSAGSYRFFQTEPSWSAQYKTFGFLFSFNYFENRGDFPYSYDDSRGNTIDENRINADIKSHNVFLKVHYKNNGHYMAVLAQRMVSNRGIPGKIDAWTAYARAENTREIAGAEYRRDLHRFIFTLNCRYANTATENSNLYPDDADKRYRRYSKWHYLYRTKNITLQSAMEYTIARWLQLSFGYSGRALAYRNENYMPSLAPPVNEADDLSNAVYLHQEWKWAMERFPVRLIVTPRIRWDEMIMKHDQVRRIEQQWSPGIGMVFSAGGKNRMYFKSHIARSFRAPTFADLFYQDSRIEGKPDLASEKANNIDIGLGGEMNGWVKVSGMFTYFHNAIEDLIVWRLGSFEVFRPFNTDAEITGQEYTLDLAMPGDLITIGLGYTNLKPLNKSENITTFDQTLPYRPRESIKASLGCNFRAFHASLIYRNVGKRYINEANTQAMPPYQIVDIGLSWTFTIRRIALTWKCAVLNLFNEEYEILRDMPLPLREWRAGLNISITP